MSQCKEPEFLEYAIQLVQQVSLCAEYTVAGEGFQPSTQVATVCKGIKLIFTGIYFKQFIQAKEKLVLVIVSNT